MPYYRHIKTDAEVTLKLLANLGGTSDYATVQDARKGMDVTTHMVTFLASGTERANWQAREYGRLNDGTYIKTPWHFDRLVSLLHYAHMSKTPGLIDYTPNDEKGHLDRQTTVKPGKYLTEFYSEVFTLEQIAAYVAECSTDAKPFKLATMEADIVAIYGATDSGFTSCMQSKRSPEYNWDRAFQAGARQHPCAVYGDSDLAVAYLGDIQTKVTARTVVWPDKKIINLRSDGKVYGDQTLLHALKAGGYSAGSIEGARIRCLKGPASYRGTRGTIMPYVDNMDGAEIDESGKWVVLGSGPLSCCNHETGYGESRINDDAYCADRDDDCDDDDSDRYICERCNDSYDFDSQSQGELNRVYCDRCIHSSSVCDHCDTRHWDDTNDVGGESWCDSCYDEAQNTCENVISTIQTGFGYGQQPCDKTWVEQAEFTSAECRERIDRHTSHLCRKCAEGKQSCVACNALFDATAMQCDCGQTVRCTETLPLELTTDHSGHIYWQAADMIGPQFGMWMWDGDSHYMPNPTTISGSTFTPESMDSMQGRHYVCVSAPIETSPF